MKKEFQKKRFQAIPPPYIDLQVNTWIKDSHGLYDYQAADDKFVTQRFYINRNCKLYRQVGNTKTIVHYQDDKKQQPMENIYIASVIKEQKKMAFRIQPSQVSKIQPHPFIRQDQPNLFKKSYVVLRDFQRDPGQDGYSLCVGDYVKLGRAQFLVIELRNTVQTKILRQTQHLQLNTGIHKVPEQPLKGSCKICLCEQDSPADPLISPCNCKGSCELVHAGCLKNWINSKVKKQLQGLATSYNFSKFQCEICKALLPKIVQLLQGQSVQMITFQKPQRPYVVLQSVTDKGQKRQELKQRNLHVICPDQKVPIRMGRGHQCQIKVNDISVSRVHSQMRYQNDKFYIKDMDSKFGTLVKFRQQLQLSDQRDHMRIQYGRTVLDLQIRMQQKTEKELLQEQMATLPVFYTQAQLKKMQQKQDQIEEPQG